MVSAFDQGGVRGFLHQPQTPCGHGLVLAHGAGSNCRAPVLAKLASFLEEAGFYVLRCDLPFRQSRRFGPPLPSDGPQDRAGLRRAAEELAKRVSHRICLGGHSYGGRQATLLAAEEPDIADALLVLSYPLHSAARGGRPRTDHFSSLRAPALFAHGARDPYGSIEEMRAALAVIPAQTELVEIQSAGHDLKSAAREIAAAFLRFLDQPVRIPIADVFDLHTVPPRDVKAVVEAYLEEAHRKGFRALRIIHGRGIGVQREIVRAVLARTPFVESFSDAPADAGGWGATVVSLRRG